MSRTAHIPIIAALMACTLVSVASAQQYYLYTPKEAAPDEKPHGRDGVLVREVEIEKGDTLYGISRRFSGIGSYYPQILLFNEIKNPNRIYTGDVLRVPVSQAAPEGKAPAVRRGAKKAAVKKTVSKAGTATAGSSEPVQPPESATAARHEETTILVPPVPARHASRKKQEKTARQPLKATSRTAQPASITPTQPPAVTGGDQSLYEQAVKAFRHEEFKTALTLFERFLAENPTSPLAADASLYKAESYLKLSGQ